MTTSANCASSSPRCRTSTAGESPTWFRPATAVRCRSPEPRETATDGGGGYFLVRVPEPGDHLDLTVSQHRDNHAAMVATWRGNRRRATVGAVLLMQLTNPLAPQMAAFGVRFQSLVLRIRGVSATPRTATRGSNRAQQHAAPAGSGWAAGGRSLAPS